MIALDEPMDSPPNNVRRAPPPPPSRPRSSSPTFAPSRPYLDHPSYSNNSFRARQVMYGVLFVPPLNIGPFSTPYDALKDVATTPQFVDFARSVDRLIFSRGLDCPSPAT